MVSPLILVTVVTADSRQCCHHWFYTTMSPVSPDNAVTTNSSHSCHHWFYTMFSPLILDNVGTTLILQNTVTTDSRQCCHHWLQTTLSPLTLDNVVTTTSTQHCHPCSRQCCHHWVLTMPPPLILDNVVTTGDSRQRCHHQFNTTSPVILPNAHDVTSPPQDHHGDHLFRTISVPHNSQIIGSNLPIQTKSTHATPQRRAFYATLISPLHLAQQLTVRLSWRARGWNLS